MRKEGTGVNILLDVLAHSTLPLYAVVPQPLGPIFFHLLNRSYRVGCTGDEARPQTYDKYPGRRNNRFLLTAAPPPYPHELGEKGRVLPDRNPRVLYKGRSHEPRSHPGDAPLPLRLSGRVFTACEPQEARNFLSAGEVREIFPQLQDEPDGGEPPYPRKASCNLEGLLIAFLVAKLAEFLP